MARLAGEWVRVGPLEVWISAGDVNPRHEHAAAAVRVATDRNTVLRCSRAEWMAFVEAVKAGKADVEVPGA